jgi:predicted ArsR family transcriptional regulator
MVSGRIQKAVLLLLLDEGQMTAQQMHERLDAHMGAIRGALDSFSQIGCVTRMPCSQSGGTARLMYGLTKKGINGALLIDPQALKDCERTTNEQH